MSETLAITRITPSECAPLRQRVLRPMQRIEDCVYEHDLAPDAMHFGAFLGNTLIGVGSLTREACPDPADRDGYRLRGMAVYEAYRSTGVGAHLMTAMYEALHAIPFTGTLWCNARTPAVPFYARHGWETYGEEFMTHPIGPHYRMWRSMSAVRKRQAEVA
ncbi:MAG: GNAT family N-acetyltransferase [bacterium]